MNDRSLDPPEFAASFRRFIELMNQQADPGGSPIVERIRAHLGSDPTKLPVLAEEWERYEQPNLQVALAHYIQRPGVRTEFIGIAAENKRYGVLGLSDMLSRGIGPYSRTLVEGPVDYINFHLDDDRLLPCVQFGLHFLTTPQGPLVVFVSGPSDQMGPRQKGRVEVMATEEPRATDFMRTLMRLMQEHSVYRGKVISLAPGQMGVQTLVQFHRLPDVRRDDVILPDGLIDRLERQTVGMSSQRDTLRAAGRSLKRGILLYGPPGVGKTLTVMYLVGRMRERTVLLMTGRGLGLVSSVMHMARTLQPAMVVMEDVDLIAQERGIPFMPSGPVLFDLLNEMDGLREDIDVIFMLTTNRPDILEPALAARPGRVDLVLELPLPDAAARRRLIELYARGLELRDVDLDAVIDRTEGASPAYIKELLRKAAVLAALADGSVVRQTHLDQALAELAEGGRLAERILGFRPDMPAGAPPAGPMTPIGMPATVVRRAT